MFRFVNPPTLLTNVTPLFDKFIDTVPVTDITACNLPAIKLNAVILTVVAPKEVNQVVNVVWSVTGGEPTKSQLAVMSKLYGIGVGVGVLVGVGVGVLVGVGVGVLVGVGVGVLV